ncbi:MAG: PPC domain-containing protein, partial [Anaerolinea sp.]|nr:PPC domain-containing protein [Anaerolinea sp.]
AYVDPAGNAVFDDIPEIRSGGRLGAQGNVNCRVSEGAPFSYIYWPQEIPPRPGSYEIEVWYQNECNDVTPVSFNLYVSVNGQEVFSDVSQPLVGERYLTSFTVLPDGSVQPSAGGIIRGVADLNYAEDLEAAATIRPNEPLTGAITPDNKFDVYVFQGTAGQVVNLAMNATSGTLDTALYLIGPINTVVAENDDAVVGENTNSLIANFTLPQDGQYIIIATHFGTLYGGTTGTYQLTLTQLN